MATIFKYNRRQVHLTHRGVGLLPDARSLVALADAPAHPASRASWGPERGTRREAGQARAGRGAAAGAGGGGARRATSWARSRRVARSRSTSGPATRS